MQDAARELGLAGFLKTTGGKGLHVVVPIEPSHRLGARSRTSPRRSRSCSSARSPIASPSKLLEGLARGQDLHRLPAQRRRRDRGRRVFDARRANAPVSTPIAWNELDRDVRFDHFNVSSVMKRVAKLKRDPWAKMAASARPLDKAIHGQVGYRGK